MFFHFGWVDGICMDILKMIKKEYMNLDLQSNTKVNVLYELTKLLDKNSVVLDFDKLLLDIRRRESLSTTGIGFKIAIPHAKSKHIKEPAIAFGRSKKGIDFDSLDGEKAHLFFLICMPHDAGNLHLKTLAQLSRYFLHESFRTALEQAKTEADVLTLLEKMEAEDTR